MPPPGTTRSARGGILPITVRMERYIVTYADFAVELTCDSGEAHGQVWRMPQVREVAVLKAIGSKVEIIGDLPWQTRRGLLRAIRRSGVLG